MCGFSFRSLSAGVVIWAVLLPLASAAVARAAGDANCDGHVDGQDLAALLEAINGPAVCPGADVNADGAVNAADLSALLALLVPRAQGPTVRFMGLASSAGIAIAPIDSTEEGVPIFARPVGVGFKLVIEGAAGLSGRPVGRVVETTTGQPDLQLETDRRLGNGGFDRCPGFVPAIDPPTFESSPAVDPALRAFACGFQVSTARTTACTLDAFGNLNWLASGTQAQFCLQIEALRQFPAGYTSLTVRLLDVDGNPGPLQRIVVLVGNPPPITATRTRTATSTTTATRTRTATPAITSTPSPSASASFTHTASASPTVTDSLPPTPTGIPTPPSVIPTVTTSRTLSPTGTQTSSQSPSLTATRTATRTQTITPTALSSTPTRSATRSTTPLPSATASITRTNSPSPLTPTRTRTAELTPTRTPTRTRTRTPTPTDTPSQAAGPIVSFLGISNADDSVATPVGTTPSGIKIYQRRFGYGFSLVVEAKPGNSRQRVGGSVYSPGDRPDLQVQVNRALGNGSAAVCDNTLPTIGGIPGLNPPTFDDSPLVSDVLNDLGCRFVNGQGAPGSRGPSEACTSFSDGSFRFVDRNSTIQYCAQIGRLFNFPSGDTLVTVRVRDVAGNLGPPAQIIVRSL